MNNPGWLGVFLCAFFAFALTVLSARAEPLPPLTADDEPLSAGQQKEIRRLIVQLGDSDWKKRQEATEALERIGELAVPLLAEAQRNPDAEIQVRAEAILKTILAPAQIEDETVICAPRGLRITGNFTTQGKLSIRGGAGPESIVVTTTARFQFKGRQFKVVRQTDGKTVSISLEIVETVGGSETKRVVEAAGEEELRQKEPELYRICLKRAGNLAERQAKIRENYSKMSGIP